MDVTSRQVAFLTPGVTHRSIHYFKLPAEVPAASLTKFTLRVNFKGPLVSKQPWIWSLYDFDQGAWVKVGDNTGVTPLIWTMLSFPVSNVTRFVSPTGLIKLMLHSNNASYDAKIDYEAITASYTPTLWQPTPGTTWFIQYSGTLNLNKNVQVYNIDLFETSKTTIQTLQAKGIKVMCYFSAGSWENWRPDAGDFPSSVLGNNLEGWPGEKWLDIRQIGILGPIMGARLDIAVDKGCDGVDPDNVDGYTNNPGFPLTYNDQLTYNLWLSQQAHARGLSIGLKNDLEQINDLVDHFEWALNEECFDYNECNLLLPFINQNKAVFGIEYERALSTFCPQANTKQFSFILKNWDLDAYQENCWDYTP